MANEKWASLEDFATLFSYFWHRDFPIQIVPEALGARRVDWTIHIGIIVRNVADLMGLYTRFEYGGRKDAIIRNAKYQDLIAVEWEWEGVWGNELEKLQKHCDTKKETLLYGVLITYTHTPNIQKVYDHVLEKWKTVSRPLLLILIDFEDSQKYTSNRNFNNIMMSVFNNNNHEEPPLRVVPALPWNLDGTRWHISEEVTK